MFRRLSQSLFESSIKSAYTRRFREKGAHAEGVFWSSRVSQTARFEQVLANMKAEFGSTSFCLADIGCGYGALFHYIQSKPAWHQIDYSGVDIRRLITGSSRCAPKSHPNTRSHPSKSGSKKTSQECSRAVLKPPNRAQERPRRRLWGPKAKQILRRPKKNPPMVGCGGLAEAGGGVRGGMLPRSSTEFARCLERFAPVEYDGCGGLSSPRATAAPLWESDVGGTSVLASFHNVFAVFQCFPTVFAMFLQCFFNVLFVFRDFPIVFAMLFYLFLILLFKHGSKEYLGSCLWCFFVFFFILTSSFFPPGLPANLYTGDVIYKPAKTNFPAQIFLLTM